MSVSFANAFPEVWTADDDKFQVKLLISGFGWTHKS